MSSELGDLLAAARAAQLRWERAQQAARRGSREYREAYAASRRASRAWLAARLAALPDQSPNKGISP